MEVEIKIISAFTKDGKGGNRAAVVLEADKLSEEQKQAIAAKVGLSETAFVSASLVADFKLDFFTPVRRIAHCGHATIATFSYLKQSGTIAGNASSKMTVDGRREIKFVGEEAYMEQKPPRFIALGDEDENRVLTALGLSPDAVASPSPVIVNTGNSFVIVEVTNEAALQNLVPRFEDVASISEKHGLIGFYIFCKRADGTVDATTRMFAPAYGIEEEAATGMAAGPLACYLYQFGNRKESYRIEQGNYMRSPSPSLLKVDLTIQAADIISVYAGGTATLVSKKTIEV
ncbi:MAG TPA: PhzF family phenazine biosynthesis protein [Flavisolibacter sp.]|nr:PhzF family phenazine biosynthesis protein [Flavisolibacter sp.]